MNPVAEHLVGPVVSEPFLDLMAAVIGFAASLVQVGVFLAESIPPWFTSALLGSVAVASLVLALVALHVARRAGEASHDGA